jgi:hypothetical protein
VLFTDMLIGIVISLPAALALLKLRPPKLRVYILLAVVPSFVWFNYWLINARDIGSSLKVAAIGWPVELLALPAAVWFLHHLFAPQAPNNSSKPKPLRGLV